MNMYDFGIQINLFCNIITFVYIKDLQNLKYLFVDVR